MKCDEDEKFLMKRTQKLFEDSLRHPWVMLDERIVKAVQELLTEEEQASADFPAGVVAGTKLILVCDDPAPLKEVILIEWRNPAKVYRRRLALKRKKNAPKA